MLRAEALEPPLNEQHGDCRSARSNLLFSICVALANRGTKVLLAAATVWLIVQGEIASRRSLGTVPEFSRVGTSTLVEQKACYRDDAEPDMSRRSSGIDSPQYRSRNHG